MLSKNLALLTVLGLVCNSHGWDVQIFQTPGYRDTIVYGVASDSISGFAYTDHLSQRASVWSRSTGERTELHPNGATTSYVLGAANGMQAGISTVNGRNVASVWRGSKLSWVNLHPLGNYLPGHRSEAYSTDGIQQVGVLIDGAHRAALWSGSASSWVDLNPIGSISSFARDVDGDRQVGYAYFGHTYQAGYWNGTKASWTLLDTPGYDYSEARGISGDSIAGTVGSGESSRAALWDVSTGQLTILHAQGATRSYANSVSRWVQGGFAVIDFTDQAGIWEGTAGSFVNLHSLLGSEYVASKVQDVLVTDTEILVAGQARYTTFINGNQYDEWRGVLWTQPVPEPGTMLALGAGILLVTRRKR